VAVAHRCTVRVALRPDDLVDLYLGQHAQPDANVQREQPMLGGFTNSPSVSRKLAGTPAQAGDLLLL
jgi:hypothetical protein